MTPNDIKPWSQLDDDMDAPAAVDAKRRSQPAAATKAGSSAGPKNRVNALAFLRAHTTLSSGIALGMLGVAVLWAVVQFIRTWDEPTGVASWQFAGITAIIVVAGGLWIVACRARQATLTEIQLAVAGHGRLTAGLTEPLAADLKSLLQAMEDHVANAEHRLADLIEQNREAMLALSLAEGHRRQAETVIDAIGEPVIVTDPFDRMMLANPAAETLFRFQRKSVFRKAVVEVFSNEKLVRIIQQTREADSRAANRMAELDIGEQTYMARLAPLSAHAVEGADRSGAHGVVITLRDITKEREAAKNKSEFVARAAHELRTPLSSIKAYVEMLVDDEAGDEATRKEYYDIIQASADRLGRMIDNVLNISRIEAGTVRINKEPVAVSVVVKEVIDVARPQAEQKRIALTEELTPVVYRVLADRDMVYQAVLNLLSNAIKYTPEGGQVHVRMAAQEQNQAIRVDVTDSGVGIPKADLPRMFEKFFRVEANKKMAKGTGLGLHLVKHIVETIHDGQMTVTSEEGKGSTFGMTLPLMKQ